VVALIVGTGGVVPMSSTTGSEVELQLLPSVTVTVYEPLAVAAYDAPVSPAIGLPPRFHWLPLALLELSVMLPVQLEVPPTGVMVGCGGSGLTVTTTAADVGLTQFSSVTTTV